jgi:VWFA-related protein
VGLEVAVFDAAGRPMTDLGREHFRVYEDGDLQQIRNFSPVATPYNILLLFDRSGSTQENRTFMRKAIVEFVEALRPQDRVALGSFDRGYDVEVGWTADRARVIAGLGRIFDKDSGNETRFYAAMERTLRREFRNVAGRRAVVVLTDGKDTDYFWENDRDLKKALKAAAEQRVPVYIIALRDDADSRVLFPRTRQYLVEVRQYMQQLADSSGGRLLFPAGLEEVRGMYAQIGRALGTSYSLGYVSPARSSRDRYRRIEVKTKTGGLRLTQSRAGYTGK